MNNHYVYMYRCQEDIPFYIGMGKNDRSLVSNHLYTGNRLLYNKINKVGKENIKIHFLHKNLTEDKALQWECYWIKYIGRRDLGEGTLCNLTNGGDKGPTGMKHTEETKRNLSKNSSKHNLGKKLSQKTKKRISEANKGRKLSEETKRKMSKAGKRKLFSKEHKINLSKNHIGMSGKHQSKETKKKISEANKDKKRTEEQKRNYSEAKKGNKNWLGKSHSEETKLKMSEARKKYWSSMKLEEF